MSILGGAMRKIIVFDTETTGLLSPNAAGLAGQPYIIEFYGVKIDENFQVLDEFETYIKPPMDIPPIITKITGISDEMVEDAPSLEEVAPKLAGFFANTTEMVAHNLAFDKAMVGNTAIRAGFKEFPFPEIETCTVQKSMSLEQRRISLTRLHELLTGKPFKDSHRARNDVNALVRCYFAMRERGMCD